MKIAVCVEAKPSAAALGATALAVSIDKADVCWIHAGPEGFEPSAVPLGVSSIVTITAPQLAQAHSQSLALVLATAVQRIGCDAVFCGVISNAGCAGIVGAAVAVQWNVPFVAQAHAVQVQGQKIFVTVHGATQLAKVAVPWPCVVACVPAPAPLPKRKTRAPLHTLTLAELGIAKEAIRKSSESESERMALPRTKTVDSVQGLIAALLARSE